MKLSVRSDISSQHCQNNPHSFRPGSLFYFKIFYTLAIEIKITESIPSMIITKEWLLIFQTSFP